MKIKSGKVNEGSVRDKLLFAVNQQIQEITKIKEFFEVLSDEEVERGTETDKAVHELIDKLFECSNLASTIEDFGEFRDFK